MLRKEQCEAGLYVVAVLSPASVSLVNAMGNLLVVPRAQIQGEVALDDRVVVGPDGSMVRVDPPAWGGDEEQRARLLIAATSRAVQDLLGVSREEAIGYIKTHLAIA